MQTTDYSKLKEQSNARNQIELNIKQYRNFFHEQTGALKGSVNINDVKKIHADLLESINNVLRNRMFSDDILQKLREIATCLFNKQVGSTEHLKALLNLANYESQFKIDISDDLLFECLKKIKIKLDEVKNHYIHDDLSQQNISEFMDELNVFLNTNIDKAKQFYEEIKVPAYGLAEHINNKLVVKGCIEDFESILSKYIDIDNIQDNVKEGTLQKQTRTKHVFDNKKSHESIETEENHELTPDNIVKSNKLKEAVEIVLDKRSDGAWIDNVMQKVFFKEPKQ